MPVLSSPITSTVQLVTSETRAHAELNELQLDCNSESCNMSSKSHLKRPIYLGDIIIGYESVTAEKIKALSSSTKNRIAKRKQHKDLNLTPLVLNQSPAEIRDFNGKKRRKDAKQLKQIAGDGKAIIDIHDENERYKLMYGDRCEWDDCEIVEEIASPKKLAQSGTVHLPETQPKKEEKDSLAENEYGYYPGNDRITNTNPLLEGEDSQKLKTCEAQSFEKFNENKLSKSFDNQDPALPLTPVSLSPVPADAVEGGTRDCSLDNNSDDTNIAVGEEVEINVDKQQAVEIITPLDICNICGVIVKNRMVAMTYLEMTEQDLKYYLCLTCNQRLTHKEEVTRHKAACFLTQEEFCCNILLEASTKCRMVACTGCVDFMRNM